MILDIDKAAVQLLIDFFYTGNYKVPDDPHLDDCENRHKKYRLHAEMIIAAEKYEIAALAELAATNFRRTFYNVKEFQDKVAGLAHALSNTSYSASKSFYDTMAEAWSFWRSPPPVSETGNSEEDRDDDCDDGTDADDDGERAFLVGNPEFATCLALKVNSDYLRCSKCGKETKLMSLPKSNRCGFCGKRGLDHFGARPAKMSKIWADMYAIER
jgi:hypothetical protein